MKYILVSGVISGVGKGIIASSTGLLLKGRGLRVTAIKIDPYLNVDAGTMAPTEHGECFVLSDGGETDLDLGNYERYLDISFTRDHNITTGKVYLEVIEKERRGDYLGKTIQVIPHISDAILERLERVSRIPVDGSGQEPDVCIIELGGTIGDIESMPFIEALTQLRHRARVKNFFNIHVSFVPIVRGEQKTKPTQHTVRTTRSAGLIPDLIACRCETGLDLSTVAKIARHCQLEPEQVMVVHDMRTIYQVPMLLEQQGLLPLLGGALALDEIVISPDRRNGGEKMWTRWKNTVAVPEYGTKVTIALVGKYTDFQDSYLSVIKALEHSASRCRRELDLKWVSSEHLEPGAGATEFETAWKVVKAAAGILCPGGFGSRGVPGKMAAARYARENMVPYLGICLGFQVAVIEVAQSLCGIADATSEELDPDAKHPVIIFMPEIDKTTMGATMRLGLHHTVFQSDTDWSKLRRLHGGAPAVSERHRHRYEVNPAYIGQLERDGGLHFVGKDEKGERMEILERKDHPFFVGVQYHPEYLSRVLNPSRPYLGLIAASAGCLDEITKEMLAGGCQQEGAPAVE